MPVELAALIVAVLWGIGAAVLAMRGRTEIKKAKPPAPHHAADPQGGRPTGQDTEELTTTPADIQATRANLSRDIDELTDKVSSARVMDSRKEAARSRLGSVKEKVMGTSSSAPSSVSGTASSATSSVADTASDTVDTLGSKAQGTPLAAGLMAFGASKVISALI